MHAAANHLDLDCHPTYFETVTAMAFWLFRELRDALFRLNIVHNELGTRIRTAAHHGSVRGSVTAAMGELNIALSIR